MKVFIVMHFIWHLVNWRWTSWPSTNRALQIPVYMKFKCLLITLFQTFLHRFFQSFYHLLKYDNKCLQKQASSGGYWKNSVRAGWNSIGQSSLNLNLIVMLQILKWWYCDCTMVFTIMLTLAILWTELA